MANKHKHIYPRKEFRYNHHKKHYNYVFGEADNKYYSLGITHQAKTGHKKNMPLYHNPQKGKNEKAYIQNRVIKDIKGSYGEPAVNFEFSAQDKPIVKSKIRHWKKRYYRGFRNKKK